MIPYDLLSTVESAIATLVFVNVIKRSRPLSKVDVSRHPHRRLTMPSHPSHPLLPSSKSSGSTIAITQ